MSDDKSPKKTGDMARRIWLAGIGAYGKAFEESRDAIRGFGSNVSGTTSDMFENLAEKGEKIEMAAKIKGAQLAGKASDLNANLGIDERIQAMRDRLSGGDDDDRIAAVEARLSAIETKLDMLIKQTAKPKRATPKRASTTRTRKTPAKTTAKKPAAKSTAAKK